MRSVLVTEFGEYEVPPSVADKIRDCPRMKFYNPFTGEVEPYDVVDMNHPPLARYYRLVTKHMERVTCPMMNGSEKPTSGF